MRTPIIIAIFILATSFSTKATVDCIWTSSKAGITIRYVASCKQNNQSFIDSFLNKVIRLLDRQDSSLKVWVLINEARISFPGSNLNYFTSIGFDALCRMRDDSIFNYYWNKTIASEDVNHGLNKFKSNLEPLDINFGNEIKKTSKGIKIIYNKNYYVDESDWPVLEKLILFAAQNVEIVKFLQTRDTVRYNANGWYVSLLTLDTFAINKVLGRESETGQKAIDQEKTKPENHYTYWLFGLLGLIVLGVTVYKLRTRES